MSHLHTPSPSATQQIKLQLQRSHYLLDVKLVLPARGITVLFGESGSGKTSLLRCVAGLEQAQNALIQIAGQCWQDDSKGIFVPTWQRPLGFVFQEASLFMHMCVQENLEYGLVRETNHGAACTAWLRRFFSKRPSALSESLVPIVKLLGIEHLLQQQPQQLSGGERQRVAIARALATNPKVLLLDEPLASLDVARRNEVMPWLEKLRDELSIPMIYVTHSLTELERLADHVVILQQGRCVASDSFESLRNSGVMSQFTELEPATWIKGTVIQTDTDWDRLTVNTPIGHFYLVHPGVAAKSAASGSGYPLTLQIQARDVILSHQPLFDSIENSFRGVVRTIEPATKQIGYSLVHIDISEQMIKALVSNKRAYDLQLQVGATVCAMISQVTVR